MSALNYVRRKIARLIGLTQGAAVLADRPSPPEDPTARQAVTPEGSLVGKVLAKPDIHRQGIALLDPARHIQAVEEHYNEQCENYQIAYGSVLQAVRSADVEELLRHEMGTMRLADGMSVLDAGCGFCGPAIWFAQQRDIRVTGVTLAESLVKEAQAAVAKAGLSDRIKIIEGDFHHLPDLVPEQSFDRVMFMETIGYSHTLPRTLAGAFHVLKPGGYIYIKDYFRTDWEPGSEQDKRSQAVLAQVYEEYRWVTFSREELAQAVQEAGFVVEHAAVMPFGFDAATVLDFDARAGFIWTNLVADGFSFGLAGEIMGRKP